MGSGPVIFDSHTIRLREWSLLRSLFEFNQSPWGPNVTCAVCWMAKGEIQEPMLHDITEAVLELKVKLGRMPTDPAVADLLVHKINHDRKLTATQADRAKQDMFLRLSNLLNGTTLNGNPQAEPLPLSIQETEALDMINFYQGKSIWRLVAATEENMRANPAQAKSLAQALKEELEKAL